MAQKRKEKPSDMVGEDRRVKLLSESKKITDTKYKALLSEVERLEKEVESVAKIGHTSEHVIKPKLGANLGEGTVVVVASDWHVEELVDPEMVSGKNQYSIAIARQRADEFFQAALRLTQIVGRDVEVNTMILALLGDFISGDIHDELLENTEMTPVEATIEAKNMLASGIRFLLDNSKLKFVIPCHSGNHARTTKDRRHATEAGHSLEYLMYQMLAEHFRGEKRITWIIPKGYHSFVDVYGVRLRLHHGHNISYSGGVGGPTVSINKAIAQWNKTRVADIDIFGHLHQRFDGGNFIMNGSMIGFNAYAVSIKASFEPPSQQFFLIDKKRGKTCVWPIKFK